MRGEKYGNHFRAWHVGAALHGRQDQHGSVQGGTAGGAAAFIQACDFGQNGYECYDPPNDQMLCQVCGDVDGYCQGGSTCVDICVKFCCDDGDCGTGTCDTTLIGDGVGICVK